MDFRTSDPRSELPVVLKYIQLHGEVVKRNPNFIVDKRHDFLARTLRGIEFYPNTIDSGPQITKFEMLPIWILDLDPGDSI